MRRTTLLTICLLLWAGCDQFFYCGLDPASTADRPVFDLGKDESLTGDAKVCAVTVAGTPLPSGCGGPFWQTFWSIQLTTGNRYRELDKLAYGTVPDGFFALVPAETLLAGYIYETHIGYHGIGTDCYFEISADSLGARTIRPLTEAEYRAILFSPGG